MHRFYLPPEQCQGSVLTLDERESHHAADVLRLRRGDPVTVLNGMGGKFLCEASDVRRKAVVLNVTQKTVALPLPCAITLIQAVPKGKLMELIIQKATELGVSRIVPLLSERVTTHLNESGAEQKSDKWQQTAIEAVKQCGQPWLPRVEVPVTVKDYLAGKARCEMALVGSLQGDGRHPREHFQAFRVQHQRNPASVALWIGPEGDFSPVELDLIRGAGALPVSFGRLVLRCETAALYGLTIVNYELS